MGTKICPKCNTENPIAANFCRKCRYEFPEASKNGETLSPKITTFRILESDYVIGSTIHVEWTVENANEVYLADDDVTVYNSCEVIVERSNKLTLTAKNDYDETSKELSIKPKQLPVFKKLRSNFATIKSGQVVKISWAIEHSNKITVKTDSEDFSVSPVNSIELKPTHTQDIVIVCESCDPSVTVEQSIHIDVLQEVQILDFKSDDVFIIESRPTKLRWRITGADNIMLYPQNLDVTHMSEVEVFPRRTTTYKITATNRISYNEASITVGVQPLPQVNAELVADLSSIKIPSIGEDVLNADSSMKKLTRWLLGNPTKKIEKDIWSNSILNKVKTILKQ
jgi:hypothetical protein